MPHKRDENHEIFTLYGTTDYRRRQPSRPPNNDLTIRFDALLLFLLLIAGVILYGIREKYSLQLEAQALRQVIADKQRQIDEAPTREQLAKEILDAIKEKSDVKPKLRKSIRRRPRKISQSFDVAEGYGRN